MCIRLLLPLRNRRRDVLQGRPQLLVLQGSLQVIARRYVVLLVLQDGQYLVHSLVEGLELPDGIALDAVHFDFGLVFVLGLVLVFLFDYLFEAAGLAELDGHFARAAVVRSLAGQLDALDGRGEDLLFLLVHLAF